MKTILPSGYEFCIDKLLDPDNFHKQQKRNEFKWILITGLIFIIWLITIFTISKKYTTLSSNVTISGTYSKVTFATIIMSVTIIMICILNMCAVQIVTYKPNKADKYLNNKFKFPVQHSNLYVSCTHKQKPIYLNDCIVYPYKLYVNNKKAQYLGEMVDGKFEYANNYPAGVFYKYLQYITKYHLEDKFKYSVYFKQDSKYLYGQHVQWILTNKSDVVLHLKDNSHVEKLTVVEN